MKGRATTITCSMTVVYFDCFGCSTRIGLSTYALEIHIVSALGEWPELVSLGPHSDCYTRFYIAIILGAYHTRTGRNGGSCNK